jgi:hypothetical protein
MPYFVLNVEITIGDKRFTRVHEVKVTNSAHSLSDKCTIKIPASARLRNGTELVGQVEVAKTFKAGDKVTVKLGYNGALRTEFEGYVLSVKPEMPVVIECIDAMYVLRKKQVQHSFKKVTLKEVLEFLVSGTEIKLSANVPVLNFDKLYFRNVTAAFALQELKEKYGLVMYLKGNVLNVSLVNHNDEREVKLTYGRNLVSSDLEWVTEDDKRLQIEAVWVKKNNTQTKVSVGPKDGEKRTVFHYTVSSEADLKKLAENDLKTLRYEGYKGSTTSFLIPNIEAGMTAVIENEDWPERNGRYQVEMVETTFGRSGARRKATLGLKLKL